jgi:hypothetical protein
MGTAAATGTDVRPFRVEIPEAELAELRRRIEATRWPSKELVSDRSQGVQLAPLQALARYWTTDHDWRKCEARLNALPQFTTEIDGVEIHFIHVRSRHENALPLIMAHGWPGSAIELLNAARPRRSGIHRAPASTPAPRPYARSASRCRSPRSAPRRSGLCEMLAQLGDCRPSQPLPDAPGARRARLAAQARDDGARAVAFMTLLTLGGLRRHLRRGRYRLGLHAV